MKSSLVLALVLLISAGTPAWSLDARFAGFGTASLSCFSSRSADFVVNDQPEGVGRTRRCDAGMDSVLGLQLDLGLTDGLDLTLQLVGDRDEKAGYAPDLDVAQLRWQPDDALTVRLGRMPTPAFLYSESRQVRFAHPWVRPPLAVYGLLPTFSHDGLEVIVNRRMADWHAEWHAGLTRTRFDSPQSNTTQTVPVDSRGGFVNLSVERGSMRAKFGYGYSESSYSTPATGALFAALRTFPSGAQLADDLQVDDSPTHLLGLGIEHEHGDWLMVGEFGFRTMEGFFRDQIGVYATLGRRYGPWMPYATLARRWTDGPASDARAGPLATQVASLLAASRFDNTSGSLGVSRVLNEQASVKLQADWIRPDGNSWGLYTNHAPDYDFRDPDEDWLFTLSVDFVF